MNVKTQKREKLLHFTKTFFNFFNFLIFLLGTQKYSKYSPLQLK